YCRLCAMATVRGYPQLVWSQVSPRNVAGEYRTMCGGFLFPATRPPGIKPPQHCASPGCPGLPLILLCSPVSAGLKNKKIPTLRSGFQ
ncbi:hypothetical protein DPX63_07740, partial [Salmonella enterica]|nr:hypothetical protein [Salmonella enterica]EBQ8947493.1 hypothetical protein [Salmonella enterica subsp. enterica serovar Agbeni]EBU8508768.1 hypothetical protein [Salmonella enterica subsp. enterica serovar Agama]EBX1547741.1 hypothetical protein [Salmonella enterica subsp. enterica serovar Wa]EBY3118295.1 hypothetical protein [Salmonella enterica subsp. enterica serovar Molade]